MVRQSWSKAVEDAIRRYVGRTGSLLFTQQALISLELSAVLSETQSTAKAPEKALVRELYRLCNVGVLEDLGRGSYRLRDVGWASMAISPSMGIFVSDPLPAGGDELDRWYRFHSDWLQVASQLVQQWIVYQGARPLRYWAIAKVGQIVPDPSNRGMYLALIEPGSFLELGDDVPVLHGAEAVEQGLCYPNRKWNKGRLAQPLRTLAEDDFFRILEIARIDLDAPAEPHAMTSSWMLREDRPGWDGPVHRTAILVKRTLRDSQFRRRVLAAYHNRCAVSGLRLIDRRGRIETEAAHLWSVEAGGCDRVTNGIALCSTAHRMFDLGMISFADDGMILVSRKAESFEGGERLINRDRRARFASNPLARPDPLSLKWHREHCFAT